MNVLVYNGPEVLQTSASRTITSLRSLLYPHYTVQAITHKSLISSLWSPTCALLVFPACQLALATSVASSVKSYVENGGAFLGIRAGIRVGGPLGAGQDYSFRLQDPTGGSTLYCTFAAGGDCEPSTALVKLADDESVIQVYQTAPVQFDGIEQARNVKVVARYSETNSVAAAIATAGNGKAALWAIHLESAIAPGVSSVGTQDAESKRLGALRSTLTSLGLKFPVSNFNSPSHTLPQFLLAARPEIVPQILDALSLTLPGEFKDDHDTFAFHAASEAESLLQSSRAAEDSNSVRHIIAYTDGTLPPTNLTPLFSPATYFSELSSARTESASSTIAANWGFGDALFYGEAVTSTQTLLDKNPHFLSSLPSPVLSLASHQLAGRGRGGNLWVSPTGCLQFSLRIHLSLADVPASRLVFIQYLFALAVAESCRDSKVLGKWGDRVRIKWPNDVYVVGVGEESRTTKVAGILVYTTFSGSGVDVVIGCGLNVQNPPPITCLANLLPPGSEKSLSAERTLAVLMTKFETLWTTFIQGHGSFEPFMDLYLDRWLHSDQVVTLTTIVPHQQVRIVGITADHGLLRTIPERGGYGGSDNFIDLQPDGNTFDLMAGLIMTKAR